MSLKRIAVLCTVALGAVALAGGGYTAAQSHGSSTTLISSPAAGTPGQAYGGASTSQLSQAALANIANAYQAPGCSANSTATTAGTTITVKVLGTPTPTGTVTLTGYDGTKIKSLTNGTASHTYPAGVVGQTINYSYGGNGTYSGCSGSADMKATPNCDVTRDKKVVTISISGSAGTASGGVTFPANGSDPVLTVNQTTGTATRTYGSSPGSTTVTYAGSTTYLGCSGTSS